MNSVVLGRSPGSIPPIHRVVRLRQSSYGDSAVRSTVTHAACECTARARRQQPPSSVNGHESGCDSIVVVAKRGRAADCHVYYNDMCLSHVTSACPDGITFFSAARRRPGSSGHKGADVPWKRLRRREDVKLNRFVCNCFPSRF